TRPLAELRRADEARFGGKSASLGELIAGEIPVPPGFAVSSEAYLAAVEGIELEGRSADECSKAILATELPDELHAEIAQAYQRLADIAGERLPAVAVRSSAIGEDSEEATFAGQQETFLWVRGASEVCEAVRSCWASLYSPEAVTYRAEMAAGHEAPAMGVAVQLMVDAAVSGVMFTCNPVSGDPSTVAINASWGLGLAVVGGEVTPDEYRVSKVTREVLNRSIGPKEIEYVPDPSGSGAARREVEAERQAIACLGDDELAELVGVARRVEGHFGAHQDIEWAIGRSGDGLGDLYMLQARPVTVKPAKKAEQAPRSAMDRVWSTFGATGTER
ncbi:MAG TPA: PEP/pyruvate-binding domain-containing protein, partial [Solirubrobacterales bacterium]|nr:PEP/pyruvate-binding domain-containing protein [Solirubrobacterales bacterium]